MRLGPNLIRWCPYVKGKLDTKRGTPGEGHVIMKAGIRGIHLQAKKH